MADTAYLKKLIRYIHYNPVRHHFCENVWDYPWSSYASVISHRPTKLHRDFVLELFEDRENFKYYHLQEPDDVDLADFIIK